MLSFFKPIGVSGTSAGSEVPRQAHPHTLPLSGASTLAKVAGSTGPPYPYRAPADNSPAERTSGGHRRDPFGISGEEEEEEEEFT